MYDQHPSHRLATMLSLPLSAAVLTLSPFTSRSVAAVSHERCSHPSLCLPAVLSRVVSTVLLLVTVLCQRFRCWHLVLFCPAGLVIDVSVVIAAAYRLLCMLLLLQLAYRDVVLYSVCCLFISAAYAYQLLTHDRQSCTAALCLSGPSR